jgi:hypothetical protein
MVKGYDPTKSDYSALLLDYCFELIHKDPKIGVL